MFGSNLPAGSMKGSGIYQTDTRLHVKCDNEEYALSSVDYGCPFEGEEDVIVNDWQTMGSWQCSICGQDNEVEMADYYDPYDYDEED